LKATIGKPFHIITPEEKKTFYELREQAKALGIEIEDFASVTSVSYGNMYAAVKDALDKIEKAHSKTNKAIEKEKEVLRLRVEKASEEAILNEKKITDNQKEQIAKR
jgi:hypothetical protein